MTGPQSRPYLYLRKTEDLVALLTQLEEHRQVVFTQAFHEASWDAVFDEAHAMQEPLQLAILEVRAAWNELREFVERIEP